MSNLYDKKIIFIIFTLLINTYVNAETVEEYEKRVNKLGDYWNTNSARQDVNEDITTYWALNLDKVKEYYKESGILDKGYMVVPYDSKLWNICTEIYAVSNSIDIESADNFMIEIRDKALKVIEIQEYKKAVDASGEYWDNHTYLRPITKEIKDYWSNSKYGHQDIAKKYFDKCIGKLKTFDIYFVVPEGSIDWNICIEIYSVYNGYNGDNFYKADKKVREQTRKIKAEIKKLQ